MSGRVGQSMTSTSCWSKKAVVSRTVWGGALSWTYTKLRPNTPVAQGNIWFLRIWMYRSRFMAPSTMTSSLLPPWWIAPHSMTDGPRFSSLGWSRASISLSPCLGPPGPDRHCGIGRTGTNHWRYSVSIVSLCFLPLSRRRRLCSKSSLRRRDQYPTAKSRLRMVRTDIRLPNRRIICIRRHPVLETRPASWLLLAENCHLPTTWQFAAVFALEKFVAWFPLKVKKNINSPYRSPTLHKSIKVVMARQTSLQVTTPELNFFLPLSLSGPQTILTVLCHSIWLRNGSMKSTVFRSAIEHTTRNNKYRSNSRKCHLVVVIP